MKVREIIQKHQARGVIARSMHGFMLNYLKIVGCHVVYPFCCECGKTLTNREEAFEHVENCRDELK